MAMSFMGNVTLANFLRASDISVQHEDNEKSLEEFLHIHQNKCFLHNSFVENNLFESEFEKEEKEEETKDSDKLNFVSRNFHHFQNRFDLDFDLIYTTKYKFKNLSFNRQIPYTRTLRLHHVISIFII